MLVIGAFPSLGCILPAASLKPAKYCILRVCGCVWVQFFGGKPKELEFTPGKEN